MKTFVIVGQANAGKSTLFNVLSDIKTTTSNFAGTSVSVAECLINVYGETIKIVDLPGLYSLNPSDNAERITTNYLQKEDIDLIINIVDSTLLARSLELTYELSELGIPMIISLNMMDDAKAKGLEIFPEKLYEIFSVPVIAISALFGKGVKELVDTSLKQSKINSLPPKFSFTKHIEDYVSEIKDDIDALNISTKVSNRFLAIKCIENPELVSNELTQNLSIKLNEINHRISKEHGTDGFEVFSYERHHLAMKTAEKVSKFIRKNSESSSEKIDKYLLHPFWGYIGLAIFHLILFVTIFYIGDFLTELITPYLDLIRASYSPLKEYNVFLWTTLDGIAQGIIGTIGIVLPYFFPLVLLNSMFEETGYLARIAFLIDNFMHKIGLHGKSVAAFILGVGCSVPAIYATRVLDSKRDRILTGILIPFVPCSARIAVIFALTAAFAGPLWAVVVFVVVLFVIAINGKLLSKFLKKPTGLILEIPALRLPSIQVSLKKTYYKINDFLKEALPFLILGSVFLSWIELFEVSSYIDFIFYPVLEYVLDLPHELGSTLVFGFFRKELILVMANQSLGVESLALLPLTQSQVMVFIIFVTLYFPCFTTFVVLLKEFGAKVGLLSAGLSIVVATITALIFRIYFEFINIFFNYL
jgi:ferrous iron transport protein B